MTPSKMREADENKWIAFDSQGKFKASRNHKSRRGRSRSRGRSHSREVRTNPRSSPQASDNATVASWMERPINSDASWMPVAPPSPTNRRSNTESALDDVEQSRQDTENGTQARMNSGRPPIGSPRNPRPGLSRASTTGTDVPTPTSRTAASRGRSRARPPTPDSPRERTRESQGATEQRQSTTPTQQRRGRSLSQSRRAPSSSSRGRFRTRGASPSPANPPPVQRHRSVSRTPRSSSRPPATRTARSAAVVVSSNSIGPGYVSRNQRTPRGRTSSADDGIVGRGVDSVKVNPLAQQSSKTKGVGIMEKLFGDSVPNEAKTSYLPNNRSSTSIGSGSSNTDPPQHVHSRILLSATVYQNTATNLWIATLNTNQKGVATNPATASKYLKAFAFQSEQEARESAIANAPPKMIPFDKSPSCHICSGKFAVFRRASHCRNCGACVCSSCHTTWPAKSLPELYNLKNEANMKVCKSCDYISTSFRKALLSGDYEQAVALYGTGNVNLRSPFPPSKSDKRQEVMHPIHCAVEGQNFDIVRWLMDDHFTPFKVVRKSNTKNKKKRDSPKDIPILTSKGRSVLSIAMSGLNVDILRYLVVDKEVSVYDMKDLKTSLHALEAVLLALPPTTDGIRHTGSEIVVPRWDNDNYSDNDECSSLGDDQSLPASHAGDSVTDACIICYANAIDCVITPCGHQICCIDCITNMRTCPVCNVDCSFIRIFRP